MEVSQNWFYDEEYKEVYIRKEKNVLLSVYLTRSTETEVYMRRFQRFDEMLGQIFGLLGLIGFGIFGVYKGFNSWCF